MAATMRDGPDLAKKLLDVLRQDIQKNNLIEDKRYKTIEQLKVLGRKPENVQSLYDTTGINVLSYYAFETYPTHIVNEARRCIANALLLFPACQQAFIDLGLAPRAADALKAQNDDEEFLISRILFLLTYNESIDLDVLIKDHALVESIVGHISRHSRSVETHSSNNLLPQSELLSLSETVKLLFNVTNAKPECTDRFNPVVPDLLKLVTRIALPSPPLQPPTVYILNALASLDFQPNLVMELDDMNNIITVLIEILDRSTKLYLPAQLETQAIPILTVFRNLNDVGGESTKDKLKDSLLPKDSERDLPLGQSSTLASRLLQLITSPGLINLPEAISSLLFELSDKDASTYIKNIGYGYAAGYLMTHNISIPENIQQPQKDRSEAPINPITGQRLDREPDTPPVEMTQEEKEREAERLFVLFERLKATGVIDVQNPAHQAMREGRFEEVNDSDSNPD